jgi:hypothetical protein
VCFHFVVQKEYLPSECFKLGWSYTEVSRSSFFYENFDDLNIYLQCIISSICFSLKVCIQISSVSVSCDVTSRVTVIHWILEFSLHINMALGNSPGKLENDFPLARQWHKVSAIQVANSWEPFGCRRSTCSEDHSEVTFHDITFSPNSLAKYSN